MLRVLLAAMLCLAAGVASATERILDFQSDVVVHASGALTVTETIRVCAEGHSIRRGIYRDFPTIYPRTFGVAKRVPFRIVSVRRDGRPEPFRTEVRENGMRVYFGRRNHFLPKGNYTYEFTYETDRQLGSFRHHDELYWNVTGSGWEFPIDHASATVTLPDTVAAADIRCEAYTGSQGERGQDHECEVNASGQAAFRATRRLYPGEGLTIVVMWPKGHVTFPTFFERLDAYKPVWIALGGLVVIAVYLFVAWALVGRDPPVGRAVLRDRPPDGLSPAGARYLLKKGYDHTCFVAALVSMAVKGYLTIDESRAKQFKICLADASEDVLSEEEAAMAAELFHSRDEIVLRQTNHVRLGKAVGALRSRLGGQVGRRYLRLNRLFLMPSLVFGVLTVLAVLDAAEPYIEAVASFPLAMLTVALIGLHIGFAVALKTYTADGRKVRDELEGFRGFVAPDYGERTIVAESQDAGALFERYLAWALALDAEARWAASLQEALDGTGEEGYAPIWYTGRHWNPRRMQIFCGTMGAGLSRAIASSSRAPGSSSGGGGGGSSGGGGGGGGGGGW